MSLFDTIIKKKDTIPINIKTIMQTTTDTLEAGNYGFKCGNLGIALDQ